MKGRTSLNKKDIWIGVIFILISIFLFRETFTFYISPEKVAEPALWPRIILGLIILLSLGLIYSGIKSEPEKKKEKLDRFGDTRVGLAILVTLIFLGIFKPIGFAISVILYFLAITYVLEPKKDIKTFAIRLIQAIVLTVVIHFVFGVALSVRLPHGILPKKWFI